MISNKGCLNLCNFTECLASLYLPCLLQVDVEISTEPSPGVEISAATPETSHTRSVMIQPSYPTPLNSETKQEEEGAQSDNLKEFTLTVQAGSFDGGSFSFDEGY